MLIDDEGRPRRRRRQDLPELRGRVPWPAGGVEPRGDPRRL